MILNELRKLSADARVQLFVLDLSPIGELLPTYYFTPMNPNGSGAGPDPIVFQGISYQPLPIQISGFEARVAGAPARPQVVIGNGSGFMSDLVAEHQDLVGAKLTRKLTFEQFLDGKPKADPLAELPSATYVIERKVRDIPGRMIEFELSSFDLDAITLPRGVVQPMTCTWKYRGEDCLYAGPNTDAADKQPGDPGYAGPDTCGKRVTSCKARHGREGDALRFAGFPGTLRMARVTE